MIMRHQQHRRQWRRAVSALVAIITLFSAEAMATIAPNDNDIIGIPIAVHIVENPLVGDAISPVSLRNFLRISVNPLIEPFGLRLEALDEIDMLPSEDLFDIDSQSELDALRLLNRAPNAINLYVVRSLTIEGLNHCVVGSFSQERRQGIVLSSNCLGEPTDFIHEFGHYLDLYDTNEQGFGIECVSGTNCDVAGDLICDTPALPADVSTAITCFELPFELGICPGDPPYIGNLLNFMTPTLMPECRVEFTPGQLERARETLLVRRPNLAITLPGVVGDRLYVRADAAPSGDGTTWAGAYDDLQKALERARNDGVPREIWIAHGVYRPDGGSLDRTRSFEVSAGLQLVGGFLGDEQQKDERQDDVPPTILCGDLLDNDIPSLDVSNLTVTDNTYTVVRADQIGGPILLESLTIRRGNAFGFGFTSTRTGGVESDQAQFCIRDCRFEDNRGVSTGALQATDIDISDSVFERNIGVGDAGAIRTKGNVNRIARCIFRRNVSYINGGGVLGQARFIDCLFDANEADNGSAIRATGDWTVFNCTFVNNRDRAVTGRPAILASNSGPLNVIRNSILWNNFQDDTLLFGPFLTDPFDYDYCCLQSLPF
ncbi:MAG: M43 family zinc metalloprotease, partial [Planctomycetota bacterium]